MVSSAGFILEYSLILRIIPKSESCRHTHIYFSGSNLETRFVRVLLGSIRNLGKCPCPRCAAPMSRVHNLGTAKDARERETLARVDDNVRQSKIKSACAHIYKSGLGVTSAAVEDLLKDQSLVPTSVSCSVCPFSVIKL